MVGAIVVSGIARGETVSLTLAPALLVAMILLMYLAPLARLRSSPRAARRLRTHADPPGGEPRRG
jgi:hypothetical protein